MAEIKTVQCKNCGAGLDFDSKTIVMRCSFCDSEYVVEIPETPEEKKLRESAEIILFNVDQTQAKETFSGWIKKGLFKPNDLVKSFREKELNGIYIPFFKVNADAETNWEGLDKKKVGDNEYEYFDRSGDHKENYKDFITASKGLNQDEVDGVLPFDDNDAKPYDPELLRSYKSERSAKKQDNAENETKKRIEKWEKQACRKKVDELKHSDTKISNLKSQLIMLPIWILVYIYQSKPFRVIINGQTGKIKGKKPVSKIKVLIFLLILAGLGVGAYFLFRRGGY